MCPGMLYVCRMCVHACKCKCVCECVCVCLCGCGCGGTLDGWCVHAVCVYDVGTHVRVCMNVSVSVCMCEWMHM